MSLNETKRRRRIAVTAFQFIHSSFLLPNVHPHSLNFLQCLLTLSSSSAFDCLIYIGLYEITIYSFEMTYIVPLCLICLTTCTSICHRCPQRLCGGKYVERAFQLLSLLDTVSSVMSRRDRSQKAIHTVDKVAKAIFLLSLPSSPPFKRPAVCSSCTVNSNATSEAILYLQSVTIPALRSAQVTIAVLHC